MHYLISNEKTICDKNGRLYVDQTEMVVEQNDPEDIDKKARELTREFYKSFLKQRFENLSILAGAGSSFDIGVGAQKGKLRNGLWSAVATSFKEELFENFCSDVKCDWVEFSKSNDIEGLLTHAYSANKFLKDNPNIDSGIQIIEKIIRTCCKLALPNDAPHIEFIKKITARKLSDPRAKIFTLNYDTLFEQAAQNAKCVLIDGFSYSEPREFRGNNFDYDFVLREGSRVKEEDNYVTNVVHIYKPHGSMDWEKSSDGKIVKNINTEKPLIIYPKESKYENSYEQPFFEMMLRFQQEVRKKNSLLIVIGFSFYDKHISNIILEALDVNPGLRCMVVTKNLDSEYLTPLHGKAKSLHNLLLIEESFSDFAKYYPYPQTYTNEITITPEVQSA